MKYIKTEIDGLTYYFSSIKHRGEALKKSPSEPFKKARLAEIVIDTK